MMRTLTTLITLGLVLAFCTMAVADNGIFEDFEGGASGGGWYWGMTSDTVNPIDGNPGGWLESAELDAPTPTLRGAWDAPGWTGDYTAMGVTGFSADIQTLSTSNAWWDLYPLYVMIVNHMGTPGDIGDDVYVYPNPDAYNPLPPGDGWQSCSWDIPSDFVGGYGELPAGWNGGTGGTTVFPSDMTWQDMMTNVGRLEVRFLYPDYAATFELYHMGADNLILYYEDGAVPTENATFGGVKALFR